MADDILIFDQRAVAAHRRRALTLDRRKRFLRDEIRARLIERLGDVKRRFDTILDLGGVDLAEDLGIDARVHTVDLTAADVVASVELLPFAPHSFDLVFSTLGLQWVNDLPGALAQLCGSLKPDGLLLAALLGGRTLYELREVLTLAELEIVGGASPRIAPFADLQSTAGLLQRAQFALPVADLETISLTYPDMFALLAELRALGETNALRHRQRSFTRRGIMLRAAKLYAERFPAPGGRIVATFDIIMLAGWAPAASQPQPLTRGSAKRSLADEFKS